MNDNLSDQEYLKRLTVLYVEDDEDAREQFAIFLRRIVGNLIVARDGAEGLKAYCDHQPAIIITDILMPVMDGLTMAAQIRGKDRAVKIIVLTAFEESDYLKRSINIHVEKYVTKPVNGIELYDALLECAQIVRADEQLQCAACCDALTGLANRQTLVNRFRAEKSMAERHGTQLSVIMADIDSFKQVNDTYGHIAGDRVLKMVAVTMMSLLRAEDTCGRWGGEEFLIILPRTSLDTAAIVAEKLRLAIAGSSIEWQGKDIAVTISMGVGLFQPDMVMDECLGAADAALYRAKDSGRNRVELAGGISV